MVGSVQTICDVETSENQTGTLNESGLIMKRVFTYLNMIMIPKFLELGTYEVKYHSKIFLKVL